MPKVTKKKVSAILEDEDTSKTDKVAEKTGDTGVKAPAKIDVAKEMKSDAEMARAALAKEEQVHFMIPLALGEKKGAFEQMWTNGYYTKIPKGVMSIIPKSLAERLAEKYSVEASAGEEFRLDLHPEKDASATS